MVELIKLKIQIFTQKIRLFKKFMSFSNGELQLMKIMIDKVNQLMKDGEV